MSDRFSEFNAAYPTENDDERRDIRYTPKGLGQMPQSLSPSDGGRNREMTGIRQ